MAKLPQNRIEEIRKARGLTLEELADKAGFSIPYVWQMSRGVRNVSIKNLERLATALDCRPEDLLSTSTGTNTDILNVWASIPPERRDLALTVLQSFTNPGIDNPHKQTQTPKSGTKTKKRL
jgi:transcriptional regulator with XRE-family HTH domain